MYLLHSEFGKKNPYLKYVSSHFLSLAIELHLVRFGLGASFILELHCSSPSTPSLLLFRFTYENMLFCFIWLDWIVRSWVSHCFYFIPTKAEKQLKSVVCSLVSTTPMYSTGNCTSATSYNYDATITFLNAQPWTSGTTTNRLMTAKANILARTFLAITRQAVELEYGMPFVKILYLTDLAQKLLSLRRDSYLCPHLAISVQR